MGGWTAPRAGDQPAGRRWRPGTVGLGLLLLLAGGCGGLGKVFHADYPGCTDFDEDGYVREIPCMESDGEVVDADQDIDCDDFDSNTYPGADEQPDGADNDCDALVDEGTINYDDDGDGFSEVKGDCDDTDAAINPAEEETVGDLVDYDCDDWMDPPGYHEEVNPQSDPYEATLVLWSEEEYSSAGETARFVGDLDGDGLDDLAWSVIFYDAASVVYVRYGTEKTEWSSGTFDMAADWTVESRYLPNLLGLGMAHGDLNGDGFDDLVLGDEFQRRVVVFYGGRRRSGAFDVEDADILFRPLEDGSFPIGQDVVVPGDLDGDGFDDLLIGQPAYDMGRGRAALFYGRPRFDDLVDMVDADAWFVGVEEADGAGNGLFSLGDLDDDGYPDFAIGAPNAITDVEGERPEPEGTLQEPFVVSPTACEDWEVNHEIEYVVARGRAYLFYGGAERWEGTVYLDQAPGNLASDLEHPTALASISMAAGDIDGDGARDLVLGLPYVNEEETERYGMAMVLYGHGKRLSGEHHLTDLPHTKLLSQGSNDLFGDSVAVADVAGDGRDDVLVTCTQRNLTACGTEPGAEPGYVAVFEGMETRLEQRVATDRGGFAVWGNDYMMDYVAGIDLGGDLDHDGTADLLVNASVVPPESITEAVILLFKGGMLP